MNPLGGKARKVRRNEARELQIRVCRSVFIHDEICATLDDLAYFARRRPLSPLWSYPDVPIKIDMDMSFGTRWFKPLSPPPTHQATRYASAVNNLVQGVVSDGAQLAQAELRSYAAADAAVALNLHETLRSFVREKAQQRHLCCFGVPLAHSPTGRLGSCGARAKLVIDGRGYCEAHAHVVGERG